MRWDFWRHAELEEAAAHRRELERELEELRAKRAAVTVRVLHALDVLKARKEGAGDAGG